MFAHFHNKRLPESAEWMTSDVLFYFLFFYKKVAGRQNVFSADWGVYKQIIQSPICLFTQDVSKAAPEHNKPS